LHQIRPSDAIARIHQEIANPSRKTDGIGQRGLDELDDVLEELFL
jgi:hypothetical protein